MPQTSLMEKQNNAFMEAYRTYIFGNAKPQSLADRLASLSDKERTAVKLIAAMVYRFSKPKHEPYLSFARRMYPKLPYSQLVLIADLLEELEPRGVTSPKDEQHEINEKAATDLYERIQVKPKQAEQNNFLDRLALSESSGDTSAEITIKDGRKFVGKYQFGDARLTDYIEATGERFTQEQFKRDLELQERVAEWHFKDIDEAIDTLGDKASGYSRDGLRAVAHLGGIAGMKKFARSGGEYNPEDELGSSLREYYEKFSG